MTKILLVGLLNLIFKVTKNYMMILLQLPGNSRIYGLGCMKMSRDMRFPTI